MIAALEADLAGLRRQLWLEQAARAVRLALALGAGLLLLGELAFRVAPMPQLPTSILALIPPATLAVGIAWVALRRPTLGQAARAADQRLRLREQLGTAVELARQVAPSPLALAQVARAREVARAASSAARRTTARSLAQTLTCCALAAGLGGLVGLTDASLAGWRRSPGPAEDAQRAPRVGVADTDTDLTSNPAGLGRLATLVQPVSGTESPSEEQLATVEQELSQATARSQAAQRSLATLAAALRQVSAGEAAAQALERGDYPAAVGTIRALGEHSDQLSADARRELSAALQAAAQASPDAPLLADRERRAAEALNFPSYAPTLGALRDLAEATDRASQAILSQSELSAAWQQLHNARLSTAGPARPGEGAVAAQSDAAAAGSGTANAAPLPGDPSVTRLESAGVPVEVPLAASANRGAPTLAQPDAAPPDRLQVVAEPADARGPNAGTQAQVARAERNSVPDEQRAVVRDYFTDAGDSP